MKEVEIGKTKYKQIESMDDIGDHRFIVFKQWILQTFENVDNSSFMAMYARIIKHFNSSDNYKIMVELENYKMSLKLKDLNYDSYSFCFALLHLAEGEDQKDEKYTKSDYQLSKLEKMRKDGLDRATVEVVVENFMKASPKHFNQYLEMLAIMSLLSKEEISSVLLD